MKKYYYYLVYISLIFVIAFLIRKKYLVIPHIIFSYSLFLSICLLFAGFVITSLSWKRILSESGYVIKFADCLSAFGLSVFAKYIPGKVWTIVGPSVYVADVYKIPVGKLCAVTLNGQFIILWLGLIFGSLGLFLLHGLSIWGWIILFLWLGLTGVIFINPIQKGIEYILKKIFHKNISVPKLSLKSTCSVLPLYCIRWLLWSASFYFLVQSLTFRDVPFSAGLGFPLAISLGIMAVISPGGLGAREGVMVGYLSLVGFTLQEATVISVAARLWFIVGEVFIFLVGLVSDRLMKILK